MTAHDVWGQKDCRWLEDLLEKLKRKSQLRSCMLLSSMHACCCFAHQACKEPAARREHIDLCPGSTGLGQGPWFGKSHHAARASSRLVWQNWPLACKVMMIPSISACENVPFVQGFLKVFTSSKVPQQLLSRPVGVGMLAAECCSDGDATRHIPASCPQSHHVCQGVCAELSRPTG